MPITIEMVVAITGFIGTLIAIYINSNKQRKDIKDELKKEIEWRTATKITLETLLRNSEETRLNQSRIDDLTKKNDLEISQIKYDIKDIYDELKSIKTQLQKKDEH